MPSHLLLQAIFELAPVQGEATGKDNIGDYFPHQEVVPQENDKDCQPISTQEQSHKQEHQVVQEQEGQYCDTYKLRVRKKLFNRCVCVFELTKFENVPEAFGSDSENVVICIR